MGQLFFSDFLVMFRHYYAKYVFDMFNVVDFFYSPGSVSIVIEAYSIIAIEERGCVNDVCKLTKHQVESTYKHMSAFSQAMCAVNIK